MRDSPAKEEISKVIRLRAGTTADRSYCLRSWIASHDHAPIARALGDAYFRGWSRIVEAQYARSEIRIACLDEEPGAIVGFAAIGSGRSLVHYCCVRSTWRRKGIAGLLLGPELTGKQEMRYTHTPPPYITVPKGWVYEPFMGAGLDKDGR